MTEHSNRVDPRREQSDPVTMFLGALIDMWGRGLSAWEMLVSGEGGRTGEQAANPFGAMSGSMAEMARSFDAMFRGTVAPSATAEAGQAAVSQVADMSPAMAQAYAVAVASTMRYWRTLAEIHSRRQASLMRATASRATGEAAASPLECRLLADEIRAFLREVGDAATQEARRLQRELETISESIARAADEATPSPHQHQHLRRHEVKQ